MMSLKCEVLKNQSLRNRHWAKERMLVREYKLAVAELVPGSNAQHGKCS